MIEVAIMMGSDSDLEVMYESCKVLEQFGVQHEVIVSSAHRSLDKTLNYLKDLESRGVKIAIVGAGMAAHLAGVVAAKVSIPVLAVPINSSPLGGLDSLYSMVQMPPGVPVPTLSIGKAGAKNAAILAVQILALANSELKTKLFEFKKNMEREIYEKDNLLKEIGIKNYISRK